MIDDPSKTTNDDQQLIRKLLDGQITAEEFAALEQRILNDPSARRRYLESADTEFALYQECSLSGLRSTESHRRANRRERWAWTWVGISSATLLILLVTVSWTLWTSPVAGPINIAENPPQAGQEPSADKADSPNAPSFTPAKSEDTPTAAILTRWNSPNEGFGVGHRFKPGTLVFGEGTIQLEFLSGAVVAIAGPAKLQITSKDSATLLLGQAVVNVPDRARGFVLNTPEAAVVDLGTEFAVDVAEDASTQVEVVDGEVEVSLLGDDGNTLRTRYLDEKRGVRVEKEGNEAVLRNVDTPTLQPVVHIADLDATRLAVTSTYVESVKESNPLLYWRFESEENGKILNESGEGWAASVVRDPSEPDSIVVTNGYVHLRPSFHPRFLAPEETFESLNDNPYTFEFWIRPDFLHHMTLVNITPPGDPLHALNVIEIVNLNSGLIHEPGAIRFLHRYPPGQSIERGVNVFDRGTTTPGQWQHVVAVRGKDSLELYCNGRPERIIECPLEDEPSPYQLYVGQLRKDDTQRQFCGALDEFAIYDRALTADEIRAHFEAIHE